MMTDDISRREMTSRHMDHVNGGRDDKMRCDVALRDLGPSRGKVEPNNLAQCRGRSDVSQTIEHARAGGVCG